MERYVGAVFSVPMGEAGDESLRRLERKHGPNRIARAFRILQAGQKGVEEKVPDKIREEIGAGADTLEPPAPTVAMGDASVVAAMKTGEVDVVGDGPEKIPPLPFGRDPAGLISFSGGPENRLHGLEVGQIADAGHETGWAPRVKLQHDFGFGFDVGSYEGRDGVRTQDERDISAARRDPVAREPVPGRRVDRMEARPGHRQLQGQDRGAVRFDKGGDGPRSGPAPGEADFGAGLAKARLDEGEVGGGRSRRNGGRVPGVIFGFRAPLVSLGIDQKTGLIVDDESDPIRRVAEIIADLHRSFQRPGLGPGRRLARFAAPAGEGHGG